MMESSSQDDQADERVLPTVAGTVTQVPVPLVVVQYRSNPVPIILLSLGMIAVALGGFAYHRRAVARLDRQAAEAAKAVMASGAAARKEPTGELADRKGTVEKRPAADSASNIAEPLALNTQPTPVPLPVTVTPDAGVKAASGASADPAAIVDRAKVAVNTDAEKSKVVRAAPDGGTVGRIAERTAVPLEKRVNAERAALAGPEKADVAATPEVVLKPLPSKEETLREIENEANQKLAEMAERERGQLDELRASRVESRSRFRKQLRELLDEQGARAGKAIDALSEQYREYVPPAVHRRASRIWSSSGRSIDQRIQLVRVLGLPESLILDLMSDDYYQNLRARNGPRTKSEVRVRAAILLLKHDPEEIAAMTEQTPRAEPGDNRPADLSPRPGIR